MANNTNAVAFVTPIENNPADWVQNQEILGARQREEKRRDDELKRLADEREQKKKDGLLDRYKNIKGAEPTGIKSIDEAQRKWMDQAMDKRLELYKKQYAGQKLTPQEEALYQKLDNTPETLALMAQSYKDELTRYGELVKKGEVKRDNKYELAMQKMADGAIPFLDDDGNPVIGIDDDGDGKPDVISYDPNTGFNFKPKYIPNVPYESTIEAISKTIEPEVNQTDSNFLKTTTTGVSLKDAEAKARGAVYNNGKPSPFAISYLYDAGIEPENITEEDLQKLQNKVAADIIRAEKRGVEQDRDYSAETSRMTERRQAKKDAKEDKEYSLNDLHNATREKVDGKVTKNNYQGDINIKRKVGNAEESFLMFGIDAQGKVTATVNVETPKYTDSEIERLTANLEGEELDKRTAELIQEKKITKRTYKENEADDVAFYAQRFTNPKTKRRVETIGEMREYLKSQGASEFEDDKVTAQSLIDKYRPKK